MNAALIYRPNNRKLIWMAFVCAIMVHATAVVLAVNKSKPVSPGPIAGIDEVIGVDLPQAAPEEDASPSEPPAITNDEEFFEEKIRTPIPRKKTPVAPVRSTSVGMTGAMRGGIAKTLALYAPRPTYPYEARRSGITGSGVAHLTVNSAAGNVIDARMSQSTGNAILDNATVSAFRRWRFKPGVAPNVDVPITYTLTGVSY
jgi:periplasmic protein TonB